jgi:uncharacterized protein Yka (UPF0111/DUF47 family)
MFITLKDIAYWLFILVIFITPSEIKEGMTRFIDTLVFGVVITTICSSIPSLVSWFQTLLDMNDYQSRVSDLEYKIDLLTERMNSVERSKKDS